MSILGASVTQFATPSVFGLNSWAEKLVANAKKELSGKQARLYEASRDLYKYTLPNRRIYYEVVQPRTASPNQFLTLVNTHGIRLIDSLWSRKEILEVCSFLGTDSIN